MWVLGPAPTPVDETVAVNPVEQSAWRVPHEQRVLAAAGPNLRTIVVRPGIVYGGCRGIVGDLFKSAANGLVRVIGTGENHWPLVYDRDLGELYVMLATNPTASGVFHANDECDERVNDLVAAITGHVSIQSEHPQGAADGSQEENGRLRGRAGARSDCAVHSRARARLGAVAARRVQERRAFVRRVAERPRGGMKPALSYQLSALSIF